MVMHKLPFSKNHTKQQIMTDKLDTAWVAVHMKLSGTT